MTIILIFSGQFFFANDTLQAQEVNWQKLKSKNSIILKSDPDNILANFKLMVALANLGQVKKAYSIIKKMEQKVSIEKFKDVIKPYINLLNETENKNTLLILNYSAFSAMIENNHHEAVNKFISVKKIDPNNIWIRNYLSVNYVDLNKYDKAKVELEQALAIKENKYSHLLLGVVYYNQGKYIKSIQEFSRSGELFEFMLEMF